MLHVSLERVQSQKKSVVQLPHVLIYLLSLCLVLETSMWHIEHIHVRIWIECLGVWEREDSFQISYFPTSMDFSHWFCHNKSLFEKFIPTKHPSEGSQCNHNQINMKPSNCKKMPNEKSLWMIFFLQFSLLRKGQDIDDAVLLFLRQSICCLVFVRPPWEEGGYVSPAHLTSPTTYMYHIYFMGFSENNNLQMTINDIGRFNIFMGGKDQSCENKVWEASRKGANDQKSTERPPVEAQQRSKRTTTASERG